MFYVTYHAGDEFSELLKIDDRCKKTLNSSK